MFTAAAALEQSEFHHATGKTLVLPRCRYPGNVRPH